MSGWPGKHRREAALNAGHTRLRPVLMTALAMIIGMLPMALAFGEGGEQNAPLGRAVIGGLIFATVGTLFLVPTIYSLLKKHPPIDYSKEIDEEAGHEGEGHGAATDILAGKSGATSVMADDMERSRESIQRSASWHVVCRGRLIRAAAAWRVSLPIRTPRTIARLGKEFRGDELERAKKKPAAAAEGADSLAGESRSRCIVFLMLFVILVGWRCCGWLPRRCPQQGH